jgi:hypothetical protein
LRCTSLAGIGLEGADAQICRNRDRARALLNAGDADGLAHQGEVDRIGRTLALHRKRDRRTGLAAHRFHGRIDVVGIDRLAVDLDDDVARLDPGAGRWRVVDRRDHQQAAVGLLQHFQAKAVVGAAGLFGERLRFVVVEIGAVRVKVGEQAADRGAHQFLIIDRVDIGLFHRAEHRDETAHFLEADAILRVGRGIALRRCGRRRC